MQAKSITSFAGPYDEGMRTGRPSKSPRTDFGARVKALREAAGFTQEHVAGKLGITQASYALWERRNVALTADQIGRLAAVLGVSADELVFGARHQSARGGPTGKARRVFEEVSQLPRNRQQRILNTVEDMLTAQRMATAGR